MSKLDEKVALITVARGALAQRSRTSAAAGSSVASRTRRSQRGFRRGQSDELLWREGGSRSKRTLPTSKLSRRGRKTVATLRPLDVRVNNAGTAIPKTFEGPRSTRWIV